MAPRRALLGLLLAPLPVLAQSPLAQSPLGGSAPPPPLPPLPAVPLAPGVAKAAPGIWRVDFTPSSDALAEPRAAAIQRLAGVLATGSVGRVTLLGLASTGEDASTQRRLALARALRVKAALVEGGLAETRIDIRALGRTDPPQDRVDILAPTAPRP